MITSLSRSLNLNYWDGIKNGRRIVAPESAFEWLEAAYEKGRKDQLTDIRHSLGIK